MAGDGDLVVRQELLGLLLGSVPGAVWDVQGIAGAGKSVLLREVGRGAAPDDVVVQLEMQDYFMSSGHGEAADVPGEAGDELRRFGWALSAVISGLRDVSTLARGVVEAILNDIGRTVQDARGLGPAEVDERAGELIERIPAQLNKLIAARTADGGKVYVLADAFEVAIDRPLGEWFLRLLAGLDSAVVAVARRVDDPGGPGLPALPAAQVLEVAGLTEPEVREYLQRRLDWLGAEIAAAVHGFTGGHALAVGLTADLASDMRSRDRAITGDGPLGQLIEQMEQSRDDASDVRLGRLLTRFIENVDPATREGLYCLLAVRRFDYPLLERLVATIGVTSSRPLAERLASYSFVERRTPPGRTGEEYYVVHDRVRQLFRDLLPHAAVLGELVTEAQDYYLHRAEAALDGYDRWFHYEDPDWQADAREWLYYVAQLTDNKRAEARLGLTRLFLDAFWWWGNYISFPFCEELLADWMEMASRSQGRGDVDRAWGTMLRDLYLRYPKGWRRRASADEWEAIQECLIFFVDRPELRDKKDSRVRHVWGLLNVYLAEAERFLDPQSEEVEENLQEARELFEADEDEWNVAWVSFQRADAALARGDVEGAVAFADEGWRDLTEMDENEFELAANLHRVHADAAWALGERGLALDLYARAALSAYKFQVSVGDPDIPPLDEYTQAFMAEMHERTAERLAVLHADGDDQAALAACARIRQFFAPYWRAAGLPDPPDQADLAALLAAGQVEDVVGQLFPPPPAPADLHQTDTAYARTATKALYKMKKALDEPPGIALDIPPVTD